jgi:hypothetical protein
MRAARVARAAAMLAQQLEPRRRGEATHDPLDDDVSLSLPLSEPLPESLPLSEPLP